MNENESINKNASNLNKVGGKNYVKMANIESPEYQETLRRHEYMASNLWVESLTPTQRVDMNKWLRTIFNIHFRLQMPEYIDREKLFDEFCENVIHGQIPVFIISDGKMQIDISSFDVLDQVVKKKDYVTVKFRRSPLHAVPDWLLVHIYKTYNIGPRDQNKSEEGGW